jgi:hypothetical protein
MRQRRINNQFADAYEDAGFDVSPSGRVYSPPRPLHPEPPKPGFSRLPEPARTSRPTTTPPSPIQAQVQTFGEIPPRLRPAYERSVLGGYELNQVGAALSAYRCAAAKNPGREPVAPQRKLTRTEWNTLLAVVEPEERAYFMRALVCKRIKLTD